MRKNKFFVAMALFVVGCGMLSSLFAEDSGGNSGGVPGEGSALQDAPAADFIVELTDDGSEVVITKYIGKAEAIRVPATIEGFPVKELRGKREWDETKSVFPDIVTSVVLPEGITKIGASAFKDCRHLTSFTIPAGVTEIEAETFANCSSLAAFTIPQGITKIGARAFSGCSGLTSIGLPQSLVDIGMFAFSGCSKLASVVLPAGITVISNGTFYGCTSLTTITVPEGVTTINAGAFAGCSGLTTVLIPASIEQLDYSNSGEDGYDRRYFGGYGACSVFADCSDLVSVTIPDSVTAIKLPSSVETTIYNNSKNAYEPLSNVKILFPDSPRLSLVAQSRIRKLNLEVEKASGGK
jgi:hypothetical protein